jgi:phosphotransferase system enzyme I (PtsP)
MEAEHEDNPALGWRAVRMGLDRPALLRLQLRALIAAARGGSCASCSRWSARSTSSGGAGAGGPRDRLGAAARARGDETLRVGAMIEAPALVWHLDALLPMTDFVSVGPTTCCSTPSPPTAGTRARATATTPVAARAAAVAGDPAGGGGERHAGVGVRRDGRAAAGGFRLTALGFERLSMPPAGIGPVKRMLLSLDREAARKGVQSLLKSGAGSVRNEFETLTRKLNVAV